jgi:hypothetical protein
MYYRYQNIQIEKYQDTGIKYFLNNVYPDIKFSNDDNYVITTVGDRMDLMALDFYSDDSLWWIIASANGLPGDSLFPPIGIQLRIPVNPKTILSDYKTTNLTR